MKLFRSIAGSFLALMFVFALSACETDGSAEEAGESVDEAVEEAGEAVN